MIPQREPRIIFFDLETIPDLRQALLVWPGLSDFPGRTLKATLNSIVCFGYKVYGSDEPAKVISAWDFPEWLVDVNDDTPLLKAAMEILEGADAVITQNGKSFDEKVLNTRLLLKGLPLFPPTKHVDTKLLAKRFSFFSNSLKYLAEQLTESRKMENEGWSLWVKTHGRDPEACRTMSTYCAQDVEALEAIFRKLRAVSSGANALPNFNLFNIGQGAEPVCPTCGSTRMIKNGVRYTGLTPYQRMRCQDCGASSRTDVKSKIPRAL